jgi:hypothetical protein
MEQYQFPDLRRSWLVLVSFYTVLGLSIAGHPEQA